MTCRPAARVRAARHRGAALLTALLLAAVVSALAASAYWMQWRSYRVERAERDRAQAAWLLIGALDWARLIVREDGRASTTDHLGEPWALALQPTQLSTFLAGTGFAAPDLETTRLAGQIEDAQARLNWRNLIDGDGATARLSAADLAAFERLYARFGLAPGEVGTIGQNLLRAWRSPATGSGPRTLRPQRLDDLRALGLSDQAYAALAPYTVWLPQRTPLNVNTATPVAWQALLPNLDNSTAQALLARRQREPFASVEAFLAAWGVGGSGLDPARLSVTSQYFIVHGQLQREGLTLQQRALLQRDGTQVRVVWLEHQGGSPLTRFTAP